MIVKVFMWRKVDPARSDPTIDKGVRCFSSTVFAKFCEEMDKKLARPGLVGKASGNLRSGVFFSFPLVYQIKGKKERLIAG